MRFMRAHTQLQQGYSVDVDRSVQLAERIEADPPITRFEPEMISARRPSADPYAAWLKQREQERRSEESPTVRWVYRYPRGAGARGEQRGGGRREASAGAGDGLVGVV